ANVKTVSLPSGAKATYTADGKDMATWNAFVADQYGNAVSGETVTWGGVTGAQPKYAAATTTTDTSGRTTNTMTSTTAATNVKATATVSSTTHTGTPVTASTPIAFTADVSKATLTVTVTGSRQPTETDTSHTAATADGTDLLTLHFKAVDGNGNAVTSTPVHYTTAVTEVGIGQNTLACKTNTTGECTSTVKTTKAGTYNVGVALVPAGATQPVSPVTTALVFLAGQPDAAKTTASVDKTAANADKNETITVTLTPRDSHSNVVPLWTFRKDLAVTPSVNATVPGAVTVSTPTQDGAGNVTATLKYVDTSGQLLSKAARTGTTSVSIGSAVKKTFDTRFYPQVNVCLTNLDSNGFVTPGTTEVHLCGSSGHTVPGGSGYKVTAPALSASGCTAVGGGVCPSDDAGAKADFTGLTGDDIMALSSTRITFQVHDVYADQDMTSSFTTGEIAFYGELRTHKPASNLGGSKDLFHTDDAKAYCTAVVRRFPSSVSADHSSANAAGAVLKGVRTGGSATNDPFMSVVQMGSISSGIKTGGDTNPEIFVAGMGHTMVNVPEYGEDSFELYYDRNFGYVTGTLLPSALVFVNGSRSAATAWTAFVNGVAVYEPPSDNDGYEVSVGYRLYESNKWNLSDAYYVNNWPGTPYTNHKGNGDRTYHYVTQVNYITGYICAASLH
ncbi:Ig-like domain-containing protein, partial [Salmonella enterica]|nr:Ig-like domain-containing protein [Salmonella enterica]